MAPYASLVELKAFLRITDASDDTLLALALDAATDAIDDTLGVVRARTEAVVTLALSAAADDIVDTAAAHGFFVGDRIRFATLTGGAGLSTAIDYYVLPGVVTLGVNSLTATSFQVALYPGGPAINFTTDITAGTVGLVVSPSVKLACQIQAARWFKRQDSPYGVLGSPEFGNYTRLLAALDPDVQLLLDGNGERTTWGTV